MVDAKKSCTWRYIRTTCTTLVLDFAKKAWSVKASKLSLPEIFPHDGLKIYLAIGDYKSGAYIIPAFKCKIKK